VPKRHFHTLGDFCPSRLHNVEAAEKELRLPQEETVIQSGCE